MRKSANLFRSRPPPCCGCCCCVAVPCPKRFGLPRPLIGTVIPDFDAIADDHGLNTAIGRSAALPMIIRLRLLAGLAVVMKNPLEHLSLMRQSRAFGPQFVGCSRKIQSSRPTHFRKAI